jgi:hypothetical protein
VALALSFFALHFRFVLLRHAAMGLLGSLHACKHSFSPERWAGGCALTSCCLLRAAASNLWATVSCCFCAVLCCAVLCCAVLCCAVLCCAVLCCAVLCQGAKG